MPIRSSSDKHTHAVQISTNPNTGMPIYLVYEMIVDGKEVETRPIGTIEYVVDGTSVNISQTYIASWIPSDALSKNYISEERIAELVAVINAKATQAYDTKTIDTSYYMSRNSSTSTDVILKEIPKAFGSGTIVSANILKDKLPKNPNTLDASVITNVLPDGMTGTFSKVTISDATMREEPSIMLIKVT